MVCEMQLVPDGHRSIVRKILQESAAPGVPAAETLQPLERTHAGHRSGVAFQHGASDVGCSGLQPHRVRTFTFSPDPGLRGQTAGYRRSLLEPARHALVLCVDEKTGIQALDRTQPLLPLSAKKPRSWTNEYVRMAQTCWRLWKSRAEKSWPTSNNAARR